MSRFSWNQMEDMLRHCGQTGMYGITVLFCLLLTSGTLGSDNATAEGNVGPFEDRSAKDGVYIGCFANGCLKFDYHPVILNSTTPDSCTTSCKGNGFAVAAVYNRTKCACSCEQTCLTMLNQRLDDNECGYPCKSVWRKLCGGFNGASLYAIPSISTSKSRCVENSHENTSTWLDEEYNTDSDDESIRFYVAAGMGCAVVIVVIIILSSLRKRDRRVVYSPRDHSHRWRAHAASQENEERPSDEANTFTDQPQLPTLHSHEANPPSDSNSTPHNESLRHAEPTTSRDSKEALPVLESNFYHVLLDDGEQSSRRYSVSTDNTYAFVDCPSHMDTLPRSAAFVHRQDGALCYPEHDDEIGHEMVNNELYAVAEK